MVSLRLWLKGLDDLLQGLDGSLALGPRSIAGWGWQVGSSRPLVGFPGAVMINSVLKYGSGTLEEPNDFRQKVDGIVSRLAGRVRNRQGKPAGDEDSSGSEE